MQGLVTIFGGSGFVGVQTVRALASNVDKNEAERLANMLDASATLDAYPAQRFIRMGPVKDPRPWHAQFEGVAELKTNVAFWKSVK